MEGLARDSMAALSFTMLTLALASGLALLLGALGLYGVLSYTIAERTWADLGDRGPDGARVHAGPGTLLFEVGATDLVTFVGRSLAMIGIGLLASYLPASRASNIDPLVAMRSEWVRGVAAAVSIHRVEEFPDWANCGTAGAGSGLSG